MTATPSLQVPFQDLPLQIRTLRPELDPALDAVDVPRQFTHLGRDVVEGFQALALRVAVDRPLHVYVVRYSATGWSTQLFPTSEDRPLQPGEPLELSEPGEIGLGFGSSVRVHPLREPGELGALLQTPGAPDRWLLFLPSGGPVWLDPQHPLPVRVDLRPPFVGVQMAPGIAAHLGGEPLGPGASVELLIGDRLHLTLPTGRLTLEVGP